MSDASGCSAEVETESVTESDDSAIEILLVVIEKKNSVCSPWQLFGLPEFAEILQICLLQGKIYFIEKKFST